MPYDILDEECPDCHHPVRQHGVMQCLTCEFGICDKGEDDLISIVYDALRQRLKVAERPCSGCGHTLAQCHDDDYCCSECNHVPGALDETIAALAGEGISERLCVLCGESVVAGQDESKWGMQWGTGWVHFRCSADLQAAIGRMRPALAGEERPRVKPILTALFSTVLADICGIYNMQLISLKTAPNGFLQACIHPASYKTPITIEAQTPSALSVAIVEHAERIRGVFA